MLLAMGLVFVLLLGEIDLSAGFAGGVCAAILAVLMLDQHDWAWYVAVARGPGHRHRHRAVHRRRWWRGSASRPSW